MYAERGVKQTQINLIIYIYIYKYLRLKWKVINYTYRTTYRKITTCYDGGGGCSCKISREQARSVSTSRRLQPDQPDGSGGSWVKEPGEVLTTKRSNVRCQLKLLLFRASVQETKEEKESK